MNRIGFPGFHSIATGRVTCASSRAASDRIGWHSARVSKRGVCGSGTVYNLWTVKETVQPLITEHTECIPRLSLKRPIIDTPAPARPDTRR